jgi:hypothetical protein
MLHNTDNWMLTEEDIKLNFQNFFVLIDLLSENLKFSANRTITSLK